MAAMTNASAAAPAENRIGMRKFGSSAPTAMAPIVGPITKPMPNAAPSSPMPRARPSGAVLSATQACPATSHAAMAPASARDRYISVSDPA